MPISGRKITRQIQPALPQPLMSRLRKMSIRTQTTRKIHSSQPKNRNIVQNALSSG
jgi:hypothetical protein